MRDSRLARGYTRIHRMTCLESILDPISRAEFRDQYYGKQPLLIRGHPGKFAGLFTWDDLNQLLNASAWPHPDVYHSLSGRIEHSAAPASLIVRCRAGSSLIIRRIHRYHSKVGALARGLTAETGEPMNINLYLSQPARAALGVHFDRHDVFVLQIDGHKAWSVYGATVERPIFVMEEERHEAPTQAVMECELAPGDVLYIPRGFWHRALAQRGMSLHLTLGVNARTGIDFLTWLVDQMRGDVRFREEMPLSFSDEPSDLREQRVRDRIVALGEILCSRLEDGETARSYRKYCVISDRDAEDFKLPAQLFEAPVTQLGLRHFTRPAHQRYVLEDGPTEDLIALSVWGNIFHIPKAAKAMLDFILSQTSFHYDDLLRYAGALTERDIQEVLDPLVSEGILAAIDAR